MMQHITTLDPTGKLLLGLLALTFIILISHLAVRLVTGHLRDDFMTPREAARAYLSTNDNNQAHPPKRAWTILFASFALMGIMILIIQNLH
jgi:hypothetical protein